MRQRAWYDCTFLIMRSKAVHLIPESEYTRTHEKPKKVSVYDDLRKSAMEKRKTPSRVGNYIKEMSKEQSN